MTKKTKLPMKVGVSRNKKQTDNYNNSKNIFPKKYLLFIPFLIMLGGVLGIYFQPPGLQLFLRTFNISPGGGTSNPIAVPAELAQKLEDEGSFVDEEFVVGLGTILPQSDVINLDTPYGSSGARIEEIFVREGDYVHKDQLLAILDNYHKLTSDVKAAEAKIEVQNATLNQTIERIISEKEDIKAQLEKAKAELEIQMMDYDREKTLLDKHVITKSKVDTRLSKVKKAEADVKKLEARLQRYDIEDVEDQVDVTVARKNLKLAHAELEKSRKNLYLSEIRAPISAQIINIYSKPGEQVSNEGVLSLGSMDKMKVNVEIYQNLREKISLNNIVRIKSNAIDQELKGFVSKIGLEVKRQNQMFDDPAANADSRVIEVEVILDDESSSLASKYTNMQVVANINTQSKADQ